MNVVRSAQIKITAHTHTHTPKTGNISAHFAHKTLKCGQARKKWRATALASKINDLDYFTHI